MTNSSRIRWNDSQPTSPSSPFRSGSDPNTTGVTRHPTPLLDQIGRDITQLARENRLNPVYGRQKELRQLQRILIRKQKNNPLLIGVAGVGKTSLVEGLASLIVRGNCAAPLKNMRIVELSVSALLMNTAMRGSFESKMEQVIREASQPNIILFIDEIHTLVRAGAVEGGALDATNILKPSLSRGSLRLIGATTPDEFDRFLRSDPAFERRFEPLIVEEPNEADAVDILMNAIPEFESHYRVTILPEAVRAAVRLTIRHIHNRHLPDKAFDILDLACAYVQLPEPEMAHSMRQPHVVDENIIELVLSNQLGIPVGQLNEDVRLTLIDLEESLSQKIFGQPIAIKRIAHALQSAYSGLVASDRPTQVMAFFGSSGVGKTATAKWLASLLFGSADAIIRLDMSEYKEPHSISRLFGAPPGYVGYDDENTLATRLRRQPHTIVLLDEIEKAHPQVLDGFLQIFDEGRFTDTHGRLVDARNAIFILTSNLYTVADIPDEQTYQSQVETIRSNLASFFRPEFVNRIQEIVLFRELDADDLKQIARLEIQNLNQRLERYGVCLVVTDAALQWIADQAIHREGGARSVLRLISREVAEPISHRILHRAVATAPQQYTLDVGADGLLKLV